MTASMTASIAEMKLIGTALVMKDQLSESFLRFTKYLQY